MLFCSREGCCSDRGTDLEAGCQDGGGRHASMHRGNSCMAQQTATGTSSVRTPKISDYGLGKPGTPNPDLLNLCLNPK